MALTKVARREEIPAGKMIKYDVGDLELTAVNVDGEFFAFEHREHALDGADADPRGGVEHVAAEALDDEFFGEFEVVIGGDVLLEFFEGLVAQVATIYQE